MKKQAFIGRKFCPFVTNVLNHQLLQNRPMDHMQDRPDVAALLESHISAMENWAFTVCAGNFVIDKAEIKGNYINVHFEKIDDAILFANEWGHPEHTTVEEYELPKYAVRWSN
jgi:hypothetical protein